MNHVTSPVLRRLHDEPRAVPDADRAHLAACARCQAASREVSRDAALAARLLAPPPAAPGSTDLAWARLQLGWAAAGPGPAGRRAVRVPRPRWAGLSLGTGTAAVVGVLAAGTGAAVALTTVYAPTHVAPVSVGRDDFRAVSAITRIGDPAVADGLPASGHEQLPFGDLSWTSAGTAGPVASIAAARARTGLPLAGPATRPAGVGALGEVVVQPRVTVTVRFAASAGGAVGGSTLVVTGGPAALLRYGGTGGRPGSDAMIVAAMQRPVATSTGATAAQLEDFLLAQRHLQAGLATELRLLGTSALPVPVPAGITRQDVTVGGAAGILLTAPADAAAGVIWESQDGVVHGVGGLLDQQDVLNVARQLG